MQRTGLALCTIGPKDDGEEEDFDVEDAYWDSFTPQEMSQLLTTIDEAGRPGKTTCTLDAPLELATQSNSVGPLGSASKVPPASSLPSSSTTSSVGLTAPASLNNDGTLRSEVLDKALGSDEAEEDAYWDNLSQASLEALEDQLRLASSQAISPGTKCLASRATTKMATIGKDEKRNGLNSSRHDKSSPPVTSPGSPTRSSRTLRSQASPPKHPYRGIYVPQFESRRGQSSGSTGGNASRAAERGLKTQTGAFHNGIHPLWLRLKRSWIGSSFLARNRACPLGLLLRKRATGSQGLFWKDTHREPLDRILVVRLLWNQRRQSHQQAQHTVHLLMGPMSPRQ